jgi:hypothetical protein
MVKRPDGERISDDVSTICWRARAVSRRSPARVGCWRIFRCHAPSPGVSGSATHRHRYAECSFPRVAAAGPPKTRSAAFTKDRASRGRQTGRRGLLLCLGGGCRRALAGRRTRYSRWLSGKVWTAGLIRRDIEMNPSVDWMHPDRLVLPVGNPVWV